MPDNNAVGRSDTIMHDGDYSVMLYTPKPYAQDPVNNWSQILYDNMVGVHLRLTGSIRTEKAGGAAFWIQCFDKSRRRILATSTTEDDLVLEGTQGWTQVSTTITPPSNTDFMMVRCVIKGAGKAWFDSLTLVVEEPKALEATDELIEPGDISGEIPTTANEALLLATKSMQSTISQLQESNQALLKELEKLRGDLEQYQQELNIIKQATPQPRGLHPLVPADFDEGLEGLDYE